MLNAGLLAIGNELLNGAIRDLNLYTLSRRLTQLGFEVGPAIIVRDHGKRIARALQFLLAHDPSILIVSGGLGPTEDDRTLAALADALGRPLTVNEEAAELVEAHYGRLLDQGHLEHRGPEEARVKMATLPAGAEPLYNPIGTAPGVRLSHDRTRLYVLPGVPEELEAMFAEAVLPDLKAHFELNTWAEDALLVHCDDEAEVAQPLKAVAERHPDVYIKSLARPFPEATREGLKILVATSAPSRSTARQAVDEALADLRRTLEDTGFTVTPLPSKEKPEN